MLYVITPAHVPLAKANHTAKSNISGKGKNTYPYHKDWRGGNECLWNNNLLFHSPLGEELWKMVLLLLLWMLNDNVFLLTMLVVLQMNETNLLTVFVIIKSHTEMLNSSKPFYPDSVNRYWFTNLFLAEQRHHLKKNFCLDTISILGLSRNFLKCLHDIPKHGKWIWHH